MKGLLSLLVIGALSACSSANTTAPITAHLVISLPAAQVTAQQGNRLSIPIEVTREDGAANPITITVSAPAGVTASVSSVSTSGNTTTASLAIAVGSTTLPGSYPIAIRAVATGYPEATASLVVDLN